jgi:C_GCAxxG_C_C family probable redox protein
LERQGVIERAEQYADEGFLCSESVLLALSEWLGIHSNLIPRVATGFAGGFGRCGSVCGAISGGVIALGLRFGRNEPKKQDRPPHWFGKELMERFEKEFGCINCKDLTGCDLSSEEGRRKYSTEQIWATKCRKYIRGATLIALDIMQKNQ